MFSFPCMFPYIVKLIEQKCQRNGAGGEDCGSCSFSAVWLSLARYPLVAEGMQQGPGACPLAVTPSFSLPLSPSQQREEQGRGCGQRVGFTEPFQINSASKYLLEQDRRIPRCRMLLRTAPHSFCKNRYVRITAPAQLRFSKKTKAYL